MDKKKIIELLNHDLEGEHAAIIQYLSHTYAMGEGELACELEAVAREEMRHLDWLAETITELGGTPTLKRGAMRTTGETVSDWMKNDVLQEEDGISLYRKHIELVDDPGVKRLLQRILSDEESHHADFQHFVGKAKKEDVSDLRGSLTNKDVDNANWGIEHEYTVILQYMYQSYLTKNEEAKKQFEDQAINEMQHLGWLAEKLIGMRSNPRIEHAKVKLSPRTANMLKDDIEIEKHVADKYEQSAGETDDTELKKLFLRMRDHEIYHSDLFGDILKEEEAQ